MAKILIVDDEEKIRFVVKEYAQFSGYEVAEASDGAQALEMLYALRPGCRLIADLEADDPAAPNGPQRARRLGLYMRQGFSESSVRYTWRGERYVILSRGGDITPDEFSAFWQNLDRINPDMAQY